MFIWLRASIHKSPTAAHSWMHTEIQRRKWPQLILFSRLLKQCFCIKGVCPLQIIPIVTIYLAPSMDGHGAGHFTYIILFTAQRNSVKKILSPPNRWENKDWERIQGCNLAEPEGKPRAFDFQVHARYIKLHCFEFLEGLLQCCLPSRTISLQQIQLFVVLAYLPHRLIQSCPKDRIYKETPILVSRDCPKM